MSKYCEPCGHLSLPEADQVDTKEDHMCRLFEKRVRHCGEHPLLPRLPECLAMGKRAVEKAVAVAVEGESL